MATADTAKLIASLELKDLLTGSVKNATKALNGLDTKLDQTQSRAFRAGQQIGTGIKRGTAIAIAAVSSLTGLLLLSAKEGQEAQNVQIKYTQAISNSGKVSAAYVKVLNDQALALSNLSGADDEAIRSTQTRLITMGLTGAQVAKLTPLILDTATRTGKDLDTITLAVGRAVQGSATSLGRLGIIVPKAEKAQKSAALTSLEYAKAQLIIKENLDKADGPLTKAEKAYYAQKKAALDASIGQQKLTDATKSTTKAVSSFDTVAGLLQQRFGGTTAALSGQLDVKLKVLNERLQDVREEAGIKLLPALTRIVDVVAQKLVPAFGGFIDSVLPKAIAGLDKLASFLESGGASSAIASFLDTAKAVAPVIERSAEATGRIIKTAVDLFRSLPPELQALGVTGLAINKLTGGLVTNIAGGLISAVISSFKGMMNVNAAVVNVNGAVAGGVPTAAAAAGGGLAALAVPVAAVAAVAVAAKLQQDNVDTQASELKLRTLAFAKTASDEQLAASIDGVRKQLAALGEGPTSNPFNVKGQTTEVLNLLITELNQRVRGGHVINAFGGVGNQPYGPTTQPGINRYGGMNGGYGPWTTMTDALKSNTSAIKQSTRAWSEVKGEINADRAARGLTGPFKRSTSLAPRIEFLRGNAAGSKDVSVANAIATGFERGATPLFKDTKLIPKAIKELQRDQRQLSKAGDTRNAALIGADIDRMKTELARRQAATTRAVKNEKAALNIGIKLGTFINGRLFTAETVRYSSVYNLGGVGPR